MFKMLAVQSRGIPTDNFQVIMCCNLKYHNVAKSTFHHSSVIKLSRGNILSLRGDITVELQESTTTSLALFSFVSFCSSCLIAGME